MANPELMTYGLNSKMAFLHYDGKRACLPFYLKYSWRGEQKQWIHALPESIKTMQL